MIHEMKSFLNRRLGKKDIQIVTDWVSQNRENRERLLSLAFCEDQKISSNALWCMTHIRKNDASWLRLQQKFLIDAVMKETSIARRRMILQLLREQDYPAEEICIDFLDFCLSKINAENEAYAVRCFSLYIAVKMCCHFPELLSELQERVELLCREPLSPGLRCAAKKVTAEIKSLAKS